MKKRLGFSLIASILLVGCEDTTQPELVGPEVPPALVFVAATPVNTFTVTNTNDVGVGSLRQAILDANGSAGFDLIDFNIPGAGPHTIQPLSNLPQITDPVTIDGYTQPGASPNTNGPGLGSNAALKIELDGSGAGTAAFGLIIESGHSTIRGLVVNRFDDIAILDQGQGANVIEGCFIGTDVTGTVAMGNQNGILINGRPGNTIGGNTPAARNVISGNRINGVAIINRFAAGNLVQGNFIGTDAGGAQALGNGNVGVEIFDAPGNVVGGVEGPAVRNVISGNGAGVVISGSALFGDQATANRVQGNFIGTDLTGTQDLGNAREGVFMFRVSGNAVGGLELGASNVIAHNGAVGVGLLFNAAENVILTNAIFSNGGLGIDLGLDGVTANDAGDVDVGDNNLQNFPVLTAASTGGSGITIVGDLNSTATTPFRVEFFANTVGDPSGHGEGETFIGATTVTTDAGGNASFAVTLPAAVAVGQFITATATGPNNNTSEFSAFVTAEPIVPFATFDIEEAEVELDEFEVEGSFAVAAGSGIDVLSEEVTVTFDGFSQTITAGSFFRDNDDQGFQFNGVTGGITRIEIRDNGGFKVKGSGIPELSGIALPSLVPFSLRIGDDIGETDIQFDASGRFPAK